MPVTHINRKRDTYYLHAGKTKVGNPRYWFSKSTEGDLVDAIPKGYEVYENPDAQVFLRKIVPQRVTPFEVAVVRKGWSGMRRGRIAWSMSRASTSLSTTPSGSNSTWRNSASASVSCRHRPSYMKVMRFTLADEDDRTFRVQRWCFRGSIDRWIDLWASESKGTSPISSRSSAPISGRNRSSS